MTHEQAQPETGAWRRLRDHIVHDVLAPSHASGRQLLRLLVPWGRSATIRPYVATADAARVQMLSLAFAVLVPPWALLDLLVFDPALGWRQSRDHHLSPVGRHAPGGRRLRQHG